MRLPIVIIGFMASGKSSLGKKLARKLALNFTDLDSEIERREGRSITQIFSEEGEVYFRRLETQVLKEVLGSKTQVIALGGGTVCHSNNLSLVKESGLSIYLKQSNSQLLGRLRQNKEKRPLVAQLNDDELRLFVREKMEERAPFYEQAHLVIEGGSTHMDDWVKRIQAFQ